MDLADRICRSCKELTKLERDGWDSYLDQLPNWTVADSSDPPRLLRWFKFKNFREALEFANRIGELAEVMDHHPDLLVTWGKLRCEIWTHNLKGLSELDFILAARIDRLINS